MYPFNKDLITLRQKKSKYHDQAKEYHYFQLLVHVNIYGTHTLHTIKVSIHFNTISMQ